MSQNPTSPNPSQQDKDIPMDVQFLKALNRLISSARIHQDNNSLLVEAVDHFFEIIGQLFQEDDEVIIQAAPGRFYLQHEKIAFRSGIASLVRSMLLFFEKRKISTIKFTPGILRSELGDITAFARLLNQSVNESDPPEWLDDQLDQERFAWAEAVAMSDEEQEGDGI